MFWQIKVCLSFLNYMTTMDDIEMQGSYRACKVSRLIGDLRALRCTWSIRLLAI